MNINGPDFDRVIRRVNELPHVFATDISNNDGEMPTQLLQACCDILDRMYNDEFSTIRRTLYHEAMYTYHYYDHYVFLDNDSENSGFAGPQLPIHLVI